MKKNIKKSLLNNIIIFLLLAYLVLNYQNCSSKQGGSLVTHPAVLAPLNVKGDVSVPIIDIFQPRVDLEIPQFNVTGTCSENDKNIVIDLSDASTPAVILASSTAVCIANLFNTQFQTGLVAPGFYNLVGSQVDDIGNRGTKTIQFEVIAKLIAVPPDQPPIVTPIKVMLPELTCQLGAIADISDSGNYACTVSGCIKTGTPNSISENFSVDQPVLQIASRHIAGLPGVTQNAFWCLNSLNLAKQKKSGSFSGATSIFDLVDKKIPLLCGKQTLKIISQKDAYSYFVNDIAITSPECDRPLHVQMEWGNHIKLSKDLDLHLVKRGGIFYDHDHDCHWNSDGGDRPTMEQDWSPIGDKKGNAVLDIDEKGYWGLENIYLNSGGLSEPLYDIYIEYFLKGFEQEVTDSPDFPIYLEFLLAQKYAMPADPKVQVSMDGVTLSVYKMGLKPYQVWYVGRVNLLTHTLDTSHEQVIDCLTAGYGINWNCAPAVAARVPK